MAKKQTLWRQCKSRSSKRQVQYFNPQNQKWIKVNIDTGRIMDVKSDGTPFKGVTKSKSLVLEQLGI